MSATADFVIRSRALQRYILANEKIIIATHRHWAMLWEPILLTAGAFVLAVAVLVAVDPNVRDDLGWVWLPFLVLGGRLLYKWLAWRSEWFIMTDRRLLLLTGLLVHRVAMMPSEKVTDLGYERTPMGQLLGYGTFIFESAGQDQALDRITWIGRPDSRYRLIIATLFHPDAADAEAAAQANPGARPPADPPEQPPSIAPPPALMPRIGRRSNPPTQRIELPAARTDAARDAAARADAARADTGRAAPGWADSGRAETGRADTAPGSVADGTTAQGATAPQGGGAGSAWSPTGGGAASGAASRGETAGGGTAGSGAAGTTAGGATSAEQARAEYTQAEYARAERARAERAQAERNSADGEHVPGGPTANLDRAEPLPNPFIEGGKDPKMR